MGFRDSIKAKVGRCDADGGVGGFRNSITAKFGRGDDDEGGGSSSSPAAPAPSRPSTTTNTAISGSSEAGKLANDPTYAVEMAIGDPFPTLIPQNANDANTKTNIRLTGVYYAKNKRYLFKKAHFSRSDRRVFDVDTGAVILVSHHEGKNPYESIDPLGYNECKTGERKSDTTVSSVSDSRYRSFGIRPKTLSRHGTQYVDLLGDSEEEVLNVAKMSKFKSKSMRPHFVVGRGKDAGKGDDMVYKIVGDIVGRTLSVENARGEVVAVMAKTGTALLKTAVYGGGSESTVDVAPGVDCSTILAIIFAVGQVGEHYVKDAFANYVQDPIQDAAVESAFGAVTGGAIGDEGAIGELAGDVGLGDQYQGVVDGMDEHVSGAGSALEGFVEDLGVTDFVEGAGDAIGDLAEETFGFFGDLFGNDRELTRP